MKTLSILATVLAVSAASMAHAKSTPQGHQPGGPVKQGNFCWVNTNGNGAGWWDRCDTKSPMPRGISQRDRADEDFAGTGSGGSGGGGNR